MNVLVLAGTVDGRKLAIEFMKEGHQVLVSTLTEYGAELANTEGLQVRSGALQEIEFKEVLREQKIEAVIDATHPYAENIHVLAQRVCEAEKVSYHRWERPQGEYPEHALIYWAQDIEEAAQLASHLGQRIFLSTGSKSLKQWVDCFEFKTRQIFVRVLPTVQVIKQVEDLGFKPYQIIAAQGPFTRDFNKALWDQLKIEVVITKESGDIGGAEEKVQACLELKIPVIILKRPKESANSSSKRNQSMQNFVRKVETKE
jgi:precorrin-6A/cobalt-precorrin-6A reductase